MSTTDLPKPSKLGEILWLEPYPDAFLEEMPDAGPNPEVLYETKEAVSLAFITALQLFAATTARGADPVRRAWLSC